jgi:hypothetical protein
VRRASGNATNPWRSQADLSRPQRSSPVAVTPPPLRSERRRIPRPERILDPLRHNAESIAGFRNPWLKTKATIRERRQKDRRTGRQHTNPTVRRREGSEKPRTTQETVPRTIENLRESSAGRAPA